MKRLSFVILAVLCLSAALQGQRVDEALRYSQIFYGGTARFMSMGGAFTALGGDLSSLSQNPAGIGVFRSSEFSISPQMLHVNTDATFRGNSSDYLYKFNLGQIGIVSNIVQDENNLTLNWGYSFNKTNNLNRSVLIQGLSNNSSMADFWADSNEGKDYEDLLDASDLAFSAWIIDTITGSGGRSYGTVYNNYGDIASSTYGQRIRRLITDEGYTGEHAFSVGGSYNNRIFFGATVGINRIRYTGHYEHLETTDAALPSEFENFTFTDHFENRGTGVNVKIGAIFKPVDALRLGFAFHSPTWYNISETFDESIVSNFSHGGSFDVALDPSRYEYALSTPFRALAGAAVQIGKLALISADYEFVDYGTAKFSETGDDYDYSQKNFAIKNTLQAAHNLRFGAELRLNKLYLRGGYGYYGKAFRAGEDNDDLDYNSVSFGIGFREQRVSIDLGLTRMMDDQMYSLYPLSDSYQSASANLTTNRNMVNLTIGYKFGY